MSNDEKASGLAANKTRVPDHLHRLDDVIGLRDELLSRIEVSVLDSFKFLVDSKASAEDLKQKANAEHRHQISDIQGLRRDESLSDTLKSIVQALTRKSDKEHSHSLKDIVSLIELRDYIRAVTYPKFTYSVQQKDEKFVFHAHLQSSNGYFMSGISLEYRYRKQGKRNWTHLESLPFLLGTFDYIATLSDLCYGEMYECEVCLRDVLNPEMRSSSGVVTLKANHPPTVTQEVK